jgi:hypothetical protein
VDDVPVSSISFAADASTGFILTLPREGKCTAKTNGVTLCFDDKDSVVIGHSVTFVKELDYCVSGLKVWKIVVVAVGVIGGIVLTYFGVICFLRYRKRPPGKDQFVSTGPLLSDPGLLDKDIA